MIRKIRVLFIGICIITLFATMVFILLINHNRDLNCIGSFSNSVGFQFLFLQTILFSIIIYDNYKRLNNKLKVFSIPIILYIIILLFVTILYYYIFTCDNFIFHRLCGIDDNEIINPILLTILKYSFYYFILFLTLSLLLSLFSNILFERFKKSILFKYSTYLLLSLPTIYLLILNIQWIYVINFQNITIETANRIIMKSPKLYVKYSNIINELKQKGECTDSLDSIITKLKSIK